MEYKSHCECIIILYCVKNRLIFISVPQCGHKFICCLYVLYLYISYTFMPVFPALIRTDKLFRPTTHLKIQLEVFKMFWLVLSSLQTSASDPAHWRHGERDGRAAAGVWGEERPALPPHRLLLLSSWLLNVLCRDVTALVYPKVTHSFAQYTHSCRGGGGGIPTMQHHAPLAFLSWPPTPPST